MSVLRFWLAVFFCGSGRPCLFLTKNPAPVGVLVVAQSLSCRDMDSRRRYSYSK